MSTEPRIRLPLAGVLIVLVAPLASLMVIVPSLFAGQVSPATAARAGEAISRALANLPTFRHGVAFGGVSPGSPAPPAPAHPAGSAAAPPVAAPTAAPAAGAPVAAGSAATEAPAASATLTASRGKHRGRRHHQPKEM